MLGMTDNLKGFRQLFSWVAFDVDKNSRNPSPKSDLSLSKICTHFAKLAPIFKLLYDPCLA